MSIFSFVSQETRAVEVADEASTSADAEAPQQLGVSGNVIESSADLEQPTNDVEADVLSSEEPEQVTDDSAADGPPIDTDQPPEKTLSTETS